MPTYEYECEACHHTFEVFQPMNSRPKRTCPECGKRRAKRLIGAGGGFLFKGSGFYETDYRSAEYKKRAAQETESTTKSETKSDSSSSDKGSSTKEKNSKEKSGKGSSTKEKK